jgi:tetratricopeptide (TPR) repeat protein
MVDLLERFHRTFLPPEELRRRAALYERRLERERAADEPNWPGIAFLCRDLAHIHRELDDYGRAGEFQERAIAAYQQAISEWRMANGEWAALQVWLGLAYADRLRGERGENLERAIECYQAALEVRTRAAFPQDWAMTQNNLGNAYRNRIRGERGENLERAIAAYSAALEAAADDEDKAPFLRNRADTYIKLHRLEEAEADCRAARDLAPDHPYTHGRWGQLHLARRQYAAAAAAFQQVLALARGPEVGFRFSLALALWGQGEDAAGEAAFRQALEQADADDRRDALEELDAAISRDSALATRPSVQTARDALSCPAPFSRAASSLP